MRKGGAKAHQDGPAGNGKHIRGLLVIRMVVWKRIEKHLELVEVAQLRRQLQASGLSLGLGQQLKEGL